jgi:tetratricopeptide (TPR) repeat protein
LELATLSFQADNGYVRFLSLLLLLWSLFLPSPLLAQDKDPVADKPAVRKAEPSVPLGDGIVAVPRLRFPSGSDRIGNSDVVRLHLQWARKDYRQHKFLNRLYTRKLNYGYRNYFDFSAALTRQGDLARKQGQTDAAVMLYNNAARFSPDLAEPRFRLFSTLLFSRPHQVMVYIPHLVRGLRIQVSEFFNILSLVSNLGLFVALILLVMLLLAWPITTFGALPAMYREFEARLPDGTTSIQIIFLMGIILVLPLLARWGVLEVVLFWTVLMWGFLRWKARFVSLLLLGVLFFSPELLTFSQKVTTVSPKELQQLYKLSRGAHTVQLAEKIKKQLPVLEKKNKVLAFEYLWALGLYHKRRGELIWARRYYSKALKWQKHPALLVNLGNVDAATRDGSKARDAYKLAMKKDSSLEEARFNLMRITQNAVIKRKFQNLSVENEFSSKHVYVFLRSSQKQLNRYLMDVEPPDSRFWELYNQWFWNLKGLEKHWPLVSKLFPFQARPVLGGGAALLLFLLWLLGGKLFPDRKSRLLLLETQELSLEERTARSLMLDFQRRMKFRVQMTLSFVVIGADYLLDGRLVAGFLRVAVMAWVVVLWWGQGLVFPHPWGLGGTMVASRWFLIGALIILGILYLSNLRRVWGASGSRS